MVNGKTIEHRPMEELMAIVRQDFKKFDDEGLIDDGTVVKTIMYCNERLGINIRDIKQICIPVEDYKAKLPLNFEKLHYLCALKATNTVVHDLVNPFNNSFDRDIIYEADIDRDSFGGTEHYGITIKRETNVTVHHKGEWIELDVHPSSHSVCDLTSPNKKRKGKYTVYFKDDFIEVPFRTGEIYMLYHATMCDEEGNLLFPFHPLITPYYEWMIKEKILMDAVFNSDVTDANMLMLAQKERVKAWLDAYDITTSKGFGELVEMQRQKELTWYNKYFKWFQ